MQNRNLYPVRAMKAFARSKPWRGTVTERKEKFRVFHAALQDAHDYRAPLMFAGALSGDGPEGGDSLASHFEPDDRRIVLKDKLSVITLLFLFSRAHFRMDRSDGMAWTIGAFKKFFPLSHSRLVMISGCYFKAGHVPARLLEQFPTAEDDGEL